MTQRPTRKIKTIVNEGIIIKRISTPEINFNENIVDIDYKITVSNIKNRLIRSIRENHRMRYFFMPELDFMLRQAGFKMLRSFKWLSTKEGLSSKSWSGLIVAKRD